MNACALMLQLLRELEHELRALGWWETTAPSQSALQSREPFCVDTLTFTQWLQWVYLSKMRAFIAEHQTLPLQSNLSAIAEEAWKGANPTPSALFALVKKLDAVVNENARSTLAPERPTKH